MRSNSRAGWFTLKCVPFPRPWLKTPEQGVSIVFLHLWSQPFKWAYILYGFFSWNMLKEQSLEFMVMMWFQGGLILNVHQLFGVQYQRQQNISVKRVRIREDTQKRFSKALMLWFKLFCHTCSIMASVFGFGFFLWTVCNHFQPLLNFSCSDSNTDSCCTFVFLCGFNNWCLSEHHKKLTTIPF